jgi:hypothetical protein
MIIGLTGKIGSGKTTAAKYFISQGFKEYGMADPIKSIGKIFGFNHEQMYGTQEQKLEVHPYWGISGREFLQKLGTEVFREAVPKIIPDMKIQRTVWVDLFELECKNNPDTDFLISDVRFLDEADLIRSLGGIIIRVVRDNEISSLSGKEHKHKSELEMDAIQADYTIDNNILSLEESRLELEAIVTLENNV